MNLDILQTEVTAEEKKYAVALGILGYKSDFDLNEHDMHFIGTYLAQTHLLKGDNTEDSIIELFTEMGNMVDDEGFSETIKALNYSVKMKSLSFSFELICKTGNLTEDTYGSFLGLVEMLEVTDEDTQKIIDVFSYLYY